MAKELYEADFPERAERFAKMGMIDTEICTQLGISKTVYYEYQQKYPEFAEAIKRGKKPINELAEEAFLKNVLGFEYEEKQSEMNVDKDGNATVAKVRTITRHFRGDTTAQIFFLKNRMPEKYKDRQEVAVDLKANSIEDMSPEEIEAEIRRREAIRNGRSA